MTLGSVHIPRTKPAASDTTPAENTQNTGERVLNISPHGALGCLALTSATLVARARRLAPAAIAGWATVAAVPARPCASRSASHSSSELDEDSAAREVSGAGAVGAEGPEATTDG